jgi:uncharacterized protein YecA (UPF0149 family)
MVSGIYGDSKAIPHLQQALDDWELEDVTDSLLANQEVIELCSAIKELGGILTLEEEKKLKDVLALREKYSEQIDLMLRMDGDDYGEEKEPIRNPKPKLGRNDPCWCGSGKKYKKCHWLSDQTSYN